jgi:DNA-binding transcriptional MerR regulator
MRGRTALYSRRHLLQLVAIKRLQARGLSLAEIQQRLGGLPNARLETLAGLPANTATPSPEGARPKQNPSDHRAAFWKAVPTLADSGECAPPLSSVASALQAIPMSAGVLLLLPATRAIHSDDLEAIQGAAAPLIKVLEKLRLLDPHHERGTV